VLYGWSRSQLSRLAELCGPTGIPLGLGMLKRSEINLQRGIRPAFPKELASWTGIHHFECRRGRYEPRSSKKRSLSCGGSIEELTNKLDVSFTGLACGRPREIVKLVCDVSLLATAPETPQAHP
jgi:hypothetical protein